MRKNVLVKVSAVLTSAVMALSAGAFSASASASNAAKKSASTYSVELSNAETLAGKVVNVDLSLYSNNKCEGYTIAVEFDSALEFRRVNGGATYAQEGNIVLISGFTAETFKDGKVGTLTFVAPEDAMDGETYDIRIADVSEFGTMDEPLFDGFTVEDSEVKVLCKATKTSNYMVFVSESEDEVVLGIRGDVNGDGVVNIFDALMVARSIMNVKGYELSDAAKYFANVDEGSNLNIFDAQKIAGYANSKNWSKV